MSFWERALPIIKERKIKQVDFITATGRSNATVSEWINKKITPRVDDAIKIADFLGVSVRYLVTGEDERGVSVMEQRLLDLCSGLSDERMATIIAIVADLKVGWRREKGVSRGTSDSVRA